MRSAETTSSGDHASAWPRLSAWLIDFLVAAVLAGSPALVTALLFAFAFDRLLPPNANANRDGSIGAVFGFLGVLMLVFGAIFLAYHTIATAKGGGFGKRIIALRVVNEADGARIPYGRAFLRSVIPLGFWMYMNIGWWVDNLWCIWDPKKQTLHDKMSGTVVIRASRRSSTRQGD